jgi:hypothetical protein
MGLLEQFIAIRTNEEVAFITPLTAKDRVSLKII